MNLPKHLAIIMDGNGRWASRRGHNRFFGHVRGAKVAKNIIQECSRRGIENLTLFTFSTENWHRPSREVAFLMNLLVRHLRREKNQLLKNNIRFRFIGNIERVPPAVKAIMMEVADVTSHNTGLNLVFALSYGGRDELVRAAKTLAEKVKRGELHPGDIDEELFSVNLESAFLPDPDLIIRTSGESRLSNFFLWQAAYSEIFVTAKFWPDFEAADLDRALKFFSERQRRFGRLPSLELVNST